MLTIKNLTKKFQNKTIIDNLSLEIPTGQLICLVGPSGGGKTTLLRCVSGLETFQAGEILLDDHPIEMQLNKIGVVFQDYHLFPHMTVLENLLLAPKLKSSQSETELGQQAKQLLSLFDLSEQVNQYPYELSGGQKQRVAIARALMLTPEVICYDEPTSALDPQLRDSVGKMLLDLKAKGITQIVVTHDHEFAKTIADKIYEVNV
ncbi:amino acid ABC transporter ATP-binding protein [Vagococcus xieshaowenii]|uniref:Amino acid ABC transporter ATP-binding protein n=1 Tax=Vagococcus xieshaowenii TaxID=2562451 RepID=A0AAJ5EE47_9ENTE|nr:ATP-binding cassette domain-containing protein [Vagococcus xieshaowenii]QCA29064.1 amino acid ABC transporter ATP-binding protein [Vagococcus xieshaowenii]TFZ40960.1 amino acid ABC transporter ATP-binding protein [Vagococcus xieshaowenii]